MRNIVDEKMRISAKKWYEVFFAENEWVRAHAGQIRAVTYKGKPSNNSFSFCNALEESKTDLPWKALTNVFPFLGNGEFVKKFQQATSGDGHELERITRLHSSSLLSFLMFCQISDDHQLCIKINNEDMKFSNVRFEVKNWIEDNDKHPSNIDVVLENDNCILFLESKFTEYLQRCRRVKISGTRYRERLKKVLEKNGEIGLSEEDYLISKESHYLEGIKQLVAHYMGLEYALRNGCYNQGVEPCCIGGRKVFLGEVLFDSPYMPKNDCFCDYSKLYSSVVDGLQTTCTSFKPMILSSLLTYQELFKGFPLDKNVKKFYRLV